jgi:hypothetical protein
VKPHPDRVMPPDLAAGRGAGGHGQLYIDGRLVANG